jgi:tetratricopeptide (TPR) repeat protein
MQEGGAAARVRHAAAVAALLACAFAVYARTLAFQPVWDDRLILDALRRAADGAGTLWHLISAPLLPDTSYYRPVVLASLQLDLLVSPVFPWSLHVTNVLLHGLVSAAVYAFCIAAGASATAALLAGLLFAATPLHLESVTFVSGRTDLLAALFALIASIAWLRGRRSNAVPAKAVGLSSLAYFLAILSKETAAVLPAVLLAWDVFDRIPRPKPSRERAGERQVLPWLCGWGLALAAALALRLGVARLGFPESLPTTPAKVAALWAAYGRLLVLPWPLRTYYTYENLPAGAVNALLALAVLAAAIGTARMGNWRAGVRALAWVAAFLLPVAGLVRPKAAPLALRFAYLSSIGVALLAAWYLDALLARRRARVPATVAVVLVAMLMGAAVWAAAAPWRSNDMLYEAMYRDAPGVPVVNFNLANLRRSAGRLAEAETLYRRVLQLEPGYQGAALNLGLTLASQGRAGEAEAAYRDALQAAPNDARVLANLGSLAFARGRWDESEAWSRRATQIEPREPKMHVNLGLALEKLGRTEEAAAAFRRALELDPGADVARRHLEALGSSAAGRAVQKLLR